MYRITTTVAAALALAGCTWVPLDPGSENVRLATQAEVARCEPLGQTTASVLDHVGPVGRNSEKVAEELATLARNSAAEKSGNAIVPTSEIRAGKRSFAIYRCPER